MTASPVRGTTGVVFDQFTLDVASHRLWRAGKSVRLRPKAWRVLCYLVERPGELVTRDTLHRVVWNDAAVTDDTLTQSIGELRRALGDSARNPHVIETVHRLGFRFIAPLQPANPAPPASPPAAVEVEPIAPAEASAAGAAPDGEPAAPAPFVGRGEELQRLRARFEQARAGARQIVLIGGETGIGKTSLVDQFLRGLDAGGGADVLRGQCVQQYGEREPYMPVLDAIERHVRGAGGPALRGLMQRLAPRVYQLLTPQHADAMRADATAASAPPSYDRVLREIAGLLEAAAARSCLILVLEDLHWSDTATMDLLSMLAQRPDPARLLVIGTYRPAEAALQEHPIRDLRQRLRTQGRRSDLALGYLSRGEVDAYLHARFGLRNAPLASAVHERTDGNPLFVVMLVDALVRQRRLRAVRGRLVASLPTDHAVPDDLREVIAGQLRSVGAEDCPLLEAASVAGVRFDARILAAVLARDQEEVDAACDRLARSHLFLQKPAAPSAPAADPAYEFTHALQQQVIYDQVPELRRRRLHRAIAEALESGHGDHAAERAPELSMHYERAGLHARAVEHLARCVGRAQQRGAHRAAATYVEQALRLLDQLPAGDERDRRELALRLLLGVSLNVTHGYAAPEVRANLDRARPLAERAGDDRQLFEIVSAIWYVELGGSDVPAARRNLEVLARLADRLDAPDLRRRATLSRGRTEFWTGHFAAAEQILAAFLDETRHDSPGAGVYGVSPIVAASLQRALALWFLGCPDQARAQAQAGLGFAEVGAAPFDVASSACQAALLALLVGKRADAQRHAQRSLTVCRDHDIGFFQSIAGFFVAASADEKEPRRLAAMREALAEHRAQTGTFVCDVMLAMIGAACGRLRAWDEGLRAVDEGIALTRTCLERIYEAELWRLRGELLIGRAARRARAAAVRQAPAAHESFTRAVEIAEAQGARSLALRARMSLVRHAANRAQRAAALAGLARLYESFSEGFDTSDLIEARALLERPPQRGAASDRG
ncbi:MAG: AAA family ATPase [Deltaproteobacteria bacterium]|nr:AAA family ATPase [Deltaproteobacteria bacterium]